jgi:uncharacterized repeat protein (TIGR03803 family)
MKSLKPSCYALSVCVAAILFAGCGGMQPPIGLPGAAQRDAVVHRAQPTSGYRIVYSWPTYLDGNSPLAGVIYARGALYGTTVFGGVEGEQCSNIDGDTCGTVFSVTPSGTETTVHNFSGYPNDGQRPVAALLDLNGTLYGTTSEGGATGTGTVFRITRGGREKVIYSFGSYPPDGAIPYASLISVDGTLYGTTYDGGTNYCRGSGIFGCGTVFSVTPSGMEKVLHSFGGGDGEHPVASLLNVNGTLYGTTPAGGANDEGTVFSLTTDGVETTLHSFGGSRNDGTSPAAGLINVKGVLYGTTSAGGPHHAGTVFSITTSGVEKVVYAFGSAGPVPNLTGAFPQASLINVRGILYGTAPSGGAHGNGTVFGVTTGGGIRVLHSFGQQSDGDGEIPLSSLVNVNGTLYGTTEYGGTGYCSVGCGTVFAVTP